MIKPTLLLTLVLATVTLAAAPSAGAQSVDDSAAPHGAVGGVQSPTSGTLALSLRATDVGLGLASATATVDGGTVAFADLGTAHVVNDVALPIDTTMMVDGTHQLVVTVRDVAGNETTIVDQSVVVVNHPVLLPATATLQIGSGSSGDGGGGGSGGVVGSGGTGNPGASPACLTPRLSAMLDQKPLRTVKHVVVLKYRKRYRFAGRLTCADGRGGRRSAAKGIVVKITDVVGRRTVREPSVKVATRGRFTVHRRYTSARTIVFTYASTSRSKAATVRIRIKVAKR